jgi:hypothetical protein
MFDGPGFAASRARPSRTSARLARARPAPLPVVRLVLLALVGSVTSAEVARAETTAAPDVVSTPAQDDAPVTRPWLYVDDPTVAPPLHVVVSSGVSLTTTGASPTRPFASNVAHPGAAYELGAEVGLVPRLALHVTGITRGVTDSKGIGVGMMAGLRVALVEGGRTSITASAGVLREISEGTGAWARVTVTEDVGRARLALTAHGEHVFAGGRDAVDVMLMAGASVALFGPLRGGVEYVVQDLEGAIDHEEAEQGVRHFVGPNLSLELDRRRLHVTAGPAIGLSHDSPRLLARAAIACSF